MINSSDTDINNRPADRRPSYAFADSLRSITLPNTVWSRSSVLQFQRWCLNWCWHSLIHSLAPSLMDCIRSGCRWQSCRCLFTRPGMLSHITRAPRAPIYLQTPNQESVSLMSGRIGSHLCIPRTTFVSY